MTKKTLTLTLSEKYKTILWQGVNHFNPSRTRFLISYRDFQRFLRCDLPLSSYEIFHPGEPESSKNKLLPLPTCLA